MDTPICDFVRTYAEKQAIRLHMPGHKGRGTLGIEALDITEIDGADVLYQSTGIIRKSQENAAFLFDSAKTVYSTEGSSLCIRAMLYLALLQAKSAGRRPLIAAGRNAHKVFMTAAALLDVDVEWLYPHQNASLLSCMLTADEVEEYLKTTEDRPVAFYLTSPDYLGNVADVAEIAEVCHRFGVLLFVDNAHGAYLRFLPESCHPLQLGADLCCDSAHKTLSVLTGGAYLHVSKQAPSLFLEMAETAMSLFASTSPSYLILRSLDAENRRLSESLSRSLTESAERVWALKKSLRRHGYLLCGNEPMKLTIATKGYGYRGTDFAALLEEKGIVCEFADPDFAVMMFAADMGTDELAHMEKVLLSIPARELITEWAPRVPQLEMAMTPHDALLAPSECLPVEQCVGRVLATPSVSCPPAVPIAVCGELLTEEAVRCFTYYGIAQCRVVI